MKSALFVRWGWVAILAFMGGMLFYQYTTDAARPASVFLVTSTVEAARQSLFDCGNISIDTREQANAYAERRPGEHVFEIRISEVK
jgi:hypothetical protein